MIFSVHYVDKSIGPLHTTHTGAAGLWKPMSCVIVLGVTQCFIFNLDFLIICYSWFPFSCGYILLF